MTKKKIRMVVTDLDGTLLRPDRTISQEAVETVARLKEQGVLFTFVTGRPPYAMEQFAQRVAVTAPIVCCNGAVIHHNGHTVASHPLDLVPLRSLMEHAAGMGLTVLLYTGGVEHTMTSTAWVQQREAAGKHFPIWQFDGHAHPTAEKVNIMSQGNESEFALLTDEIEQLRQQYSIALYGQTGCEIVASGVSKATGLAELCQLCGVSPEETLAIGDNENDHPMLQAAGIGAAVANATPKTKVVADYCCTAPYTDGVIEAIARFVLGEDAK